MVDKKNLEENSCNLSDSSFALLLLITKTLLFPDIFFPVWKNFFHLSFIVRGGFPTKPDPLQIQSQHKICLKLKILKKKV